MIFSLLLASIAFIIVVDAAQNGADIIRLPIKQENSLTLGVRDGPQYGPDPLRTNATQKHYLSPYTVEVAIGSPPQLVHVALDPFTNFLWVDPDCSTSLSPEACCANGVYNPNNSATAEPEDCSRGWAFAYSQGGATGCSVVDDVQFAGVDLGFIEVGIANHSWGQSAGQLGLGFGCKAAGDVSILDHLKQKGLVTKRQFSIAIGSANDIEGTREDADAGLGELVFSGVNTGKFAGELRQVGAIPSTGHDPSYYVTLTSIGLSDPFNCKDLQRPFTSRHAVFDFSTIMSYFPSDIMLRLTEFFPDGFYNLTKGVYEVPCSHLTHDGSVDFYFEEFHIGVPMRDFILEVDGSCYLGAVRNRDLGSDEAILGLSFLRAAYTVYDIDNDEIYVAQYENCGDNLVDWDPSHELYGLCASKPTGLPSSCSSTSISPTSTTSMSYPMTSETTTLSTTSTTHSSTSTTSTHSSTRSTKTSTPSSLLTPQYPTTSSSSSSHSTSHSLTHSTRRPVSHSTTRPMTHSTTSPKTLSTESSILPSSHSVEPPYTEPTYSVHRSTTKAISTTTSTTSAQARSSTSTSSRKTSGPSSRPHTSRTTARVNSTTTISSLTSLPWSSGLMTTGGRSSYTSGGTPGGTSIFWTPGTGFSWSNVSFTPGSTGRWTPRPTTTGTLTTTSLSSTSSESTLTSVPASEELTSTTSTEESSLLSSGASTGTSSPSSSIETTESRADFPIKTETETATEEAAAGPTKMKQSDEKTVTVTVGLVTSTVFMPSPITIPVSTCNCSWATVTVVSRTRDVETETETELWSSCKATEYRTRTVTTTASHCGTTTTAGRHHSHTKTQKVTGMLTKLASAA